MEDVFWVLGNFGRVYTQNKTGSVYFLYLFDDIIFEMRFRLEIERWFLIGNFYQMQYILQINYWLWVIQNFFDVTFYGLRFSL